MPVHACSCEEAPLRAIVQALEGDAAGDGEELRPAPARLRRVGVPCDAAHRRRLAERGEACRRAAEDNALRGSRPQRRGTGGGGEGGGGEAARLEPTRARRAAASRCRRPHSHPRARRGPPRGSRASGARWDGRRRTRRAPTGHVQRVLDMSGSGRRRTRGAHTSSTFLPSEERGALYSLTATVAPIPSSRAQ